MLVEEEEPMTTVLAAPPAVRKKGRFGIDPDTLYRFRDGVFAYGRIIIEVMERRMYRGDPLIVSFCPLCHNELVLAGSGFRCDNCGQVSEEG